VCKASNNGGGDGGDYRASVAWWGRAAGEDVQGSAWPGTEGVAALTSPQLPPAASKTGLACGSRAKANSLMTSVPSRVGRQVDTGEKWTEATIPFPKAGVPREQMSQAQPRYALEEVGVKLS
jgi:hypothetical protein